jgi:hypothetical protein
MIRQIIYLILIASTHSICLSQTNLDKFPNDCYSDKIRLNTKEREFKDTVVMVRNYIDKIDEKRIICNDLIVDRDIYKLIWECKYIKTYLTYQNKMNKFSIVSCISDNENNMIASYFLCDRKTKETVEMIRFKIANKTIIGINIFPNIYDGFVPVDEFDNQKTDRID